MAENNPEFQTVIGPDASFKGELSFEKGLRMHGKFEGRINTSGKLHVAKEAKMQADVEAGSIVVEGDVRGNLVASDKIEIKNNARYEGDLTAAKLTVDEGATLIGHVQVGPEAGGKRGGPSPVSTNRPVPPVNNPQNQPNK